MPTLGKPALRKSILDFLVNFMNFGTQQEPGNLSMAVLTEFTDSHPDHLLCYLLESSNILQFWREIFRECGENSGLFFLFNLIVSHSAFIFFLFAYFIILAAVGLRGGVRALRCRLWASLAVVRVQLPLGMQDFSFLTRDQALYWKADSLDGQRNPKLWLLVQEKCTNKISVQF